jgi:hypothetical protein
VLAGGAVAEASEIVLRSGDVFNDHDERSPNLARFIVEGSTGIRLGGGDDPRIRLRGFVDARIRVQAEAVCGASAVQQCIVEATHTAVLERLDRITSPTRRTVVISFVQIARYEHGLATEVKLYYDQTQLLPQLGLTPAPLPSDSMRAGASTCASPRGTLGEGDIT